MLSKEDFQRLGANDCASEELLRFQRYADLIASGTKSSVAYREVYGKEENDAIPHMNEEPK